MAFYDEFEDYGEEQDPQYPWTFAQYPDLMAARQTEEDPDQELLRWMHEQGQKRKVEEEQRRQSASDHSPWESFTDMFTVPNAMRSAGSTLGGIAGGAGAAFLTRNPRLAMAGMSAGSATGAALGDVGARWWTGEEQNPWAAGVEALSAGLTAPLGLNMPGKGAGGRALWNFAKSQAGVSMLDAGLSANPRKMAEEGIWDKQGNINMVSPWEMLGQMGVGGLVGGTLGAATGKAGIEYGNWKGSPYDVQAPPGFQRPSRIPLEEGMPGREPIFPKLPKETQPANPATTGEGLIPPVRPPEGFSQVQDLPGVADDFSLVANVGTSEAKAVQHPWVAKAMQQVDNPIDYENNIAGQMRRANPRTTDRDIADFIETHPFVSQAETQAPPVFPPTTLDEGRNVAQQAMESDVTPPVNLPGQEDIDAAISRGGRAANIADNASPGGFSPVTQAARQDFEGIIRAIREARDIKDQLRADPIKANNAFLEAIPPTDPGTLAFLAQQGTITPEEASAIQNYQRAGREQQARPGFDFATQNQPGGMDPPVAPPIHGDLGGPPVEAPKFDIAGMAEKSRQAEGLPNVQRPDFQQQTQAMGTEGNADLTRLQGIRDTAFQEASNVIDPVRKGDTVLRYIFENTNGEADWDSMRAFGFLDRNQLDALHQMAGTTPTDHSTFLLGPQATPGPVESPLQFNTPPPPGANLAGDAGGPLSPEDFAASDALLEKLTDAMQGQPQETPEDILRILRQVIKPEDVDLAVRTGLIDPEQGDALRRPPGPDDAQPPGPVSPPIPPQAGGPGGAAPVESPVPPGAEGETPKPGPDAGVGEVAQWYSTEASRIANNIIRLNEMNGVPTQDANQIYKRELWSLFRDTGNAPTQAEFDQYLQHFPYQSPSDPFNLPVDTQADARLKTERLNQPPVNLSSGPIPRELHEQVLDKMGRLFEEGQKFNPPPLGRVPEDHPWVRFIADNLTPEEAAVAHRIGDLDTRDYQNIQTWHSRRRITETLDAVTHPSEGLELNEVLRRARLLLSNEDVVEGVRTGVLSVEAGRELLSMPEPPSMGFKAGGPGKLPGGEPIVEAPRTSQQAPDTEQRFPSPIDTGAVNFVKTSSAKDYEEWANSLYTMVDDGQITFSDLQKLRDEVHFARMQNGLGDFDNYDHFMAQNNRMNIAADARQMSVDESQYRSAVKSEFDRLKIPASDRQIDDYVKQYPFMPDDYKTENLTRFKDMTNREVADEFRKFSKMVDDGEMTDSQYNTMLDRISEMRAGKPIYDDFDHFMEDVPGELAESVRNQMEFELGYRHYDTATTNPADDALYRKRLESEFEAWQVPKPTKEQLDDFIDKHPYIVVDPATQTENYAISRHLQNFANSDPEIVAFMKEQGLNPDGTPIEHDLTTDQGIIDARTQLLKGFNDGTIKAQEFKDRLDEINAAHDRLLTGEDDLDASRIKGWGQPDADAGIHAEPGMTNQQIADRDRVTMNGVPPSKDVPVEHDEFFGGFQTHVRGDEYWVTHPTLDKPKGPFKDSDAASDWIQDHQDSPEFDAASNSNFSKARQELLKQWHNGEIGQEDYKREIANLIRAQDRPPSIRAQMGLPPEEPSVPIRDQVAGNVQVPPSVPPPIAATGGGSVPPVSPPGGGGMGGGNIPPNVPPPGGPNPAGGFGNMPYGPGGQGRFGTAVNPIGFRTKLHAALVKAPTDAAFKWWVNHREAAQSFGGLIGNKFKKFDNVSFTQYQQNPQAYPEVHDYFADWHRDLTNAGVKMGQKDSYLPQLWENPQAVAQLPQTQQNRLLLKPGFTFNAMVQNYEEGIKQGLIPKFKTISELGNFYETAARKAMADRQFFEYLKQNKLIKPRGAKGSGGWQPLNLDIFPTAMLGKKPTTWVISPQFSAGKTLVKGKPRMGREAIENYLTEDKPIYDKIANFASNLKNLRLVGGVPFTGINQHGWHTMTRWLASSDQRTNDFVTGAGYLINPRAARRKLASYGAALPDARAHGLTVTGDDFDADKFLRPGSPKGVLERTNHALDKIYADPLFRNIIPALKMSRYEGLASQYIKPGMNAQQIAAAKNQAAQEVNALFGGINWKELGESKHTQNLLRTFALAPDWLRTNVQGGKRMYNALLDPNSPQSKMYLRMGANLIAATVTASAMNKTMTGRWSHENDSGHEMDIAVGKDSKGKIIYIRPFGTAADFARLPLQAVKALTIDQEPGQIPQMARNRTSIPVGKGLDWYGGNFRGEKLFSDRYGKKKDYPAILKGLLEDASDLLPNPVEAPIDWMRGSTSGQEAISRMFEAPLGFAMPKDGQGKGRKRIQRKSVR